MRTLPWRMCSWYGAGASDSGDETASDERASDETAANPTSGSMSDGHRVDAPGRPWQRAVKVAMGQPAITVGS